MRDQAQERIDEPETARPNARILPFRPRPSALETPSASEREKPGADDSGPDEFRHRMLVNAAGLLCAALLTLSGIWLASRISELRQTQDCILSGRRDCAPVASLDQRSPPLHQH